MKALVTGSTGFVGRHLITKLLTENIKVSCLVRKESKVEVLKEYNVEVLKTDYLNIQSLKNSLGRYDYVFHVAGVINARNWDTYYRANCQYTENLLKALSERNKNLKKFIFISSISASGPSKKGLYISESFKCNPISLYGKSKLIAENIVLQYRDKIPVVIIRPPNILGPFQHELLEAIKLVNKRIIPIVGNGEVQTSICYIKDLVDICYKVALNKNVKGKTYFVTFKQGYAWQEITAQIADQLNIKGLTIKIPYFIQYIVALFSEIISLILKKPPIVSRENLLMSRKYYWLYDSQKIKNELGLAPQTDLKEAIKKTITYYQEKKVI